MREVKGLEGLTLLEKPWRRLAGAATSPAYYHDFDWYRAFLVGGWTNPDQVRFLVGSESDGRVRMICPVERRIQVIRRVPFEVWALPGSGTEDPKLVDVRRMATGCDLLCDYPEVELDLFGVIRDCLRRTASRPSILLLGNVVSGSAAWRVAQAGLRDGGVEVAAGSFNVVRTDRPFPELEAGLSRNFRGNLRKARNKLLGAGCAEFETVGPGQDLAQAYEEFLTVEASGWKGSSGSSTAVAKLPRVDSFLRTLLSVEGPDLQPEIHMLRLDGRPIAAQFWIRYRNQMVLPKIGYDEGFRKLAPGQLLLERALEVACRDETVSSVNLVGDSSWHDAWGPDRVQRPWFYLPIRKPRGLLPLAFLRLPNATELRARLSRYWGRGAEGADPA